MSIQTIDTELMGITLDRKLLEHKKMDLALLFIFERAQEAIGLFDQDEALRAIAELASQARPEE